MLEFVIKVSKKKKKSISLRFYYQLFAQVHTQKYKFYLESLL